MVGVISRKSQRRTDGAASDGRGRSCCRWRIRSSPPASPTTAFRVQRHGGGRAAARHGASDAVRSRLATGAYGQAIAGIRAIHTRVHGELRADDRRVSRRHAVFRRRSGAGAVGARDVHRFGRAGLRPRGLAAVGERARCVLRGGRRRRRRAWRDRMRTCRGRGRRSRRTWRRNMRRAASPWAPTRA